MVGSASYDTLLVVAVLLGATLCLAPIALLMRMTRNRQKEPVVVVSPDAARRHSVLVWLIRGSGALFATVSAIGMIYLVVEVVVDALHGRMGIFGWGSVAIGIFMAVAVCGFICKTSCEIFQKVNTITVVNFACIVSIAFACDFHYLIPRLLPQFPEAKNFAFLAFYLFYRITKAGLLKVLELTPPASPRQPPIDPDIPEFPQKSPLVQM